MQLPAPAAAPSGRRGFSLRSPLIWLLLGLLLLILLLGTLLVWPALAGSPAPTSVRMAVVGDFGLAGRPERDVAQLVQSWQPDLVLTVGDNNYDDGAAATIDANVGQYYHQYIAPYIGRYGAGATTNRFFPVLGNHDWTTAGAQGYLDYFTLPGNERYYDVAWGPVHLFALDSDPHEPDGVTMTSTQAIWLQQKLAAAQEPWKLVYFHHTPYSSGITDGATKGMRWPFAQWGASAVLAGHEHNYERVMRDGIPYFVNGLGGCNGCLYPFGTPTDGSAVRYYSDFGSMRIDATAGAITFTFITRTGQTIDTYTLPDSSATPAPATPAPGS